MNNKLSWQNVIVALFLLMAFIVFLLAAITGEAKLNPKIPLWMDIYIQICIYSIVPLVCYIGIFSKFNNPFSKQPNLREDKQ